MCGLPGPLGTQPEKRGEASRDADPWVDGVGRMTRRVKTMGVGAR